MPTGYTSSIAEGISFNDFVMQCARGMGACVTMRDDPANAKIPDEFKPSDYHVKELEKAEKRLKGLKFADLKESSQKAQNEYNKKLVSHKKYIKEKVELEKKYKDMLNHVGQWKPPTSDHIGFKNFMVEQLTKSIEFDCGTTYWVNNAPELLSGEDWLKKEEKEAVCDVRYHTKENQEEVDRATKRTDWIKHLRGSLIKKV